MAAAESLVQELRGHNRDLRGHNRELREHNWELREDKQELRERNKELKKDKQGLRRELSNSAAYGNIRAGLAQGCSQVKKEQVEELKRGRECPLCMEDDRPVSVALVPCGHCLCGVCALQHSPESNCPICRGNIQGQLKVHLAC